MILFRPKYSAEQQYFGRNKDILAEINVLTETETGETRNTESRNYFGLNFLLKPNRNSIRLTTSYYSHLSCPSEWERDHCKWRVNLVTWVHMGSAICTLPLKEDGSTFPSAAVMWYAEGLPPSRGSLKLRRFRFESMKESGMMEFPFQAGETLVTYSLNSLRINWGGGTYLVGGDLVELNQ